MTIDIANPSQYVKVNNLPEITSGNIFKTGSTIPDPEGLGSYEIFGPPGTPQRKQQFAYIDLGDTFVHPQAYEVLKYLKRITIDVIAGNGDFYIKDGQITKVSQKDPPPKGVDVGNGANWLKKHLREIIFEKDNMSELVKERVEYIQRVELDEIFIDKWLVLPPFYRDVDVQNGGKKNVINMIYQSILSQARAIKSSKDFFTSVAVTDSHRRIQEKLNEYWTYVITFLAGTKTFTQGHIIGKGVAYSSRMVISTPIINSDTPDTMEVDFSHSACPLSMVINNFAPFIHFGFKRLVYSMLRGSNFITTVDSNGKMVRKPLARHWENVLLTDNIEKLIRQYVDSVDHRLDPFLLECEDGTFEPLAYIREGVYEHKEIVPNVDNMKKIVENSHPITMCEMFYMAAMQTVKDKPILITRYPVEDYNNIYPSFMNIIPFNSYGPRTVDGVYYERFPKITKNDIKDIENIYTKFTDSLRICPLYLSALGADFDGDQVSTQGVFTENNGCKEYITSLTNIVNIGGGTMRKGKDISVHTLYALTKDRNVV